MYDFQFTLLTIGQVHLFNGEPDDPAGEDSFGFAHD
jgi:hypothetical protein